LPCAGVAELADVVAHQLLDRRAGQRGDRAGRVLQQRRHLAVGQVRDRGQVGGVRLGAAPGGGVAVDQFEDPAGGEVLGDQGQLREGQGAPVVELVDAACALAQHGLEPAGDLAAGAEFGGQRALRLGPLREREARGGAGLDGVGLLATADGGAVVLVALGIAAGKRRREGGRAARAARGRLAESVEEVEEVVGILAGPIDADEKMHGAVSLRELFEPLAEDGRAGGGLGEGQLRGGGLEVVAQEDRVVAVPGRVDAHAEAARRLRGGNGVW
jgi:hypothetical protein